MIPSFYSHCLFASKRDYQQQESGITATSRTKDEDCKREEKMQSFENEVPPRTVENQEFIVSFVNEMYSSSSDDNSPYRSFDEDSIDNRSAPANNDDFGIFWDVTTAQKIEDKEQFRLFFLQHGIVRQDTIGKILAGELKTVGDAFNDQLINEYSDLRQLDKMSADYVKEGKKELKRPMKNMRFLISCGVFSFTEMQNFSDKKKALLADCPHRTGTGYLFDELINKNISVSDLEGLTDEQLENLATNISRKTKGVFDEHGFPRTVAFYDIHREIKHIRDNASESE